MIFLGSLLAGCGAGSEPRDSSGTTTSRDAGAEDGAADGSSTDSTAPATDGAAEASSDAGGVDGDADGGGGGDASPDAADEGGTTNPGCTTLVDLSAPVTPSSVGVLPVMTGGTVPLGTFVLTQVEYTGAAPPAAALRGTYRFQGPFFEYASGSNADRGTWLKTNGASLVLQATCPVAGVRSRDFSLSTNTVRERDGNGSSTWVRTFTRSNISDAGAD